MKSILITGASGFIGPHLLRRLAPEDPVTCAALSNLEPLFESHRFTHVYHLAAAGVRAESERAQPCVSCNTLGTFELARMAVRFGVERFVFVGSGFEYRPQATPTDESAPLQASNLYGASKAAGWMLLDYLRREEGLPLVTVRPFAVYGPGEHPSKLIPYVLARARERKPIRLGGGEQIRDYLHVDDVIDALIAAGNRPEAVGRVYNLGGGAANALSVRVIVHRILDLVEAPVSLCEFGAALRPRTDPAYLVANPARAAAELQWRARVTLDAGLRDLALA
ncbi:MAG: NAD-dependent epimerase/dehydratase family protein [Acidobacteriota bacterium]|nr:NAD-dependent epimerase/dehydratase family protein [Acidobacteriota bacterium]